MKRSDKNNFVKKMKDELKNSSSIVVAHYSGLSVLETDYLRKEMRNNGTKFKIIKNRLTKNWREGANFLIEKNATDLLS